MKMPKIVGVLAAVIFVFMGVTANAQPDISVKMYSIASNNTEYVSFTKMKPMQIDSRTLTPARDMAQAAGMTVEWDQPTQTALLTLKADANSDKPVERYAAELISKVKGYGLDLTPKSITAAITLNSSKAVIRYNFTDSDGDNVPMGKNYEMLSKAIFIEDGTLMIPMRDSMEMFGLEVSWNQEELCASVAIPDEITQPEGLTIIANHGEGPYAAKEEQSTPVDPQTQYGAYIGNFKITHYCTCPICNGGWGSYTAWAGEVIPGQTIAVNPEIIPKLSWVYIDGYGYRRAEDTGSGIGQYHIDVAVPTHAMAMEMGVVYKDVYFAE